LDVAVFWFTELVCSVVNIRLTRCEGYQWNTNLFPSPPAFIAWAHSKGDFELVLNIHDQCGVDVCQAGYADVAAAVGMPPDGSTAVPCRMLNKNWTRAHAQFVLESGDNAGVDYWWNDYGMGGPGVGAFQLACWSNDSNPNPPKSYPHCMRCYDDDVDKKPALWNAFVRVSRRENHGQRGMVLGIYGGLGHHRYPVCCPPLRDWSFFPTSGSGSWIRRHF
jgi:hypothetical protein